MAFYAGGHFPAGEHAGSKIPERIPLNLLNRGINVLMAHLAGQPPKPEVGTDIGALRPESKLLELALTRLLAQLRMDDVIRQVVFDALVSPWGVVRRGMKAGQELDQIDEQTIRAGQPYVRRVSLDDYVLDPTAERLSSRRWDAERYRMSIDDIEASPAFDSAVVRKLREYGDNANNDEAMEGERGRVLMDLTRLRDSDPDDALRRVELMDVAWYDDDGGVTIATMCGRRPLDEFLRVYKWQGPEPGPFDHLCFQPIPDNPIGVPFAANALEQAETAASLMLKYVEEVERSKRILLYPRGQDDIVDAIGDAEDGDKIGVDDPAAVQVAELQGQIGGLLEAIGAVQSWWNIGSGNTDVLGGASSGAQTATEFQGLQANASVVLASMQSEADRFWSRCVEHLGWYLTTDPYVQIPMVHRGQGPDAIELEYSAEAREGEFQAFAFKVRPGTSRLRLDPNVQIQRLAQFPQLSAAAMQAEMLSGGAWRSFPFIREIAELLGIEAADEIIADEMMLAVQMATQRATQPTQPGVVGAGQPGRTGFQVGNRQHGSNSGNAIDQGRSAAMQQPTPIGAA